MQNSPLALLRCSTQRTWGLVVYLSFFCTSAFRNEPANYRMSQLEGTSCSLTLRPSAWWKQVEFIGLRKDVSSWVFSSSRTTILQLLGATQSGRSGFVFLFHWGWRRFSHPVCNPLHGEEVTGLTRHWNLLIKTHLLHTEKLHLWLRKLLWSEFLMYSNCCSRVATLSRVTSTHPAWQNFKPVHLGIYICGTKFPLTTHMILNRTTILFGFDFNFKEKCCCSVNLSMFWGASLLWQGPWRSQSFADTQHIQRAGAGLIGRQQCMSVK